MDHKNTKENFDWLLNPISPHEFFKDYWENKPLTVNNRNPLYYKTIFNLEDVDKTLQRAQITKENIFAAKNGKKVPASELLSVEDVARMSKLFDYFSKGYTVYFYQLHLLHDAVRDLCRNLENDSFLEANPAVFLTPPQSQGTPPHYDVPDLFVLQLEGHKRWQIYPPKFKLPMQKNDVEMVDPETLQKPSHDVVLSPGDLLYLPRGYIHAPRTEDDYSLHLTIGFIPRFWFEVLTTLVDGMYGATHFREAIPLQALRDGSATCVEDAWRNMLKRFVDDCDLNMVLQGFRESFYANRGFSPDGHFRRLLHLHQVTAQTKVERRSHVQASVQWEANHSAAIVFSGGKLLAPPHTFPTLADICEREGIFTPADLGGDIGSEDKLILVRRLIKAGMLRQVENF